MSNPNAEPMLRFLSKGTAFVQHYGAMKAGQRRFHGWEHKPNIGAEYEDGGEKRRHGAFAKRLGHIIEVPMSDPHVTEYIRHLRDGDLWPADEYTAQFSGRPFDPTFGGEHDVPTPPDHADVAREVAGPAPEAPTHDAAHSAAAE